MATDKERLVDLFRGFGIAFEDQGIDPPDPNYPGATSQIVLESRTEKVCGYLGFNTDFAFDAEGKFVSVGIWE